MSIMTKVDGCPDSDVAKPGMAHFAGTGPFDKKCGDCKFKGYSRQSRKETWNERLQRMINRSYRTGACGMFLKLTGNHGPAVDKDWPSCKYFEQAPKA